MNVKGFENIPTMAELGHPQINITKLRGILGPKDMEQDVVDAIVTQIRAMLDAQSFKDYVSANGLIVDIRTGTDFTRIMEEQTDLLKNSIENSLK